MQVLAGPTELRRGFFGFVLRFIALTTLVLFPLLLLLLLQIQFLPYHDSRITWVHRGALFVDLLLVWWLWQKIFADHGLPFWHHLKRFAGVGASLAAITFSWAVATFPSEWKTFPLSYFAVIEPEAATKFVFGMVDARTGTITGNWPTNTLRLQGFDIYEGLKVEDPKKLDWKEHIFDLHRRQLEGAVFFGAKLGKVNLNDANLEGAMLDGAQLQGASLIEAQLQGASLDRAQLQGASLEHAELQGAVLREAKLQGAMLRAAQLQGTALDQAQLEGAELYGVELQGASLNAARLQGASIEGVRVHLGGPLNEALFLVVPQLQGASLKRAQLQGASLSSAQMQGASLDGAAVNATDFSGAFLWRTTGTIDAANLGVIQLHEAILQPRVIKRSHRGSLDESTGKFTLLFRRGPVLWDSKEYKELRDSMNSIPEGKMRDDALKRIEILDCDNQDKTLASCDPGAEPPFEVLAWQNQLAGKSVDDTALARALATELKSLVCANDANAIHILRGLFAVRLYATDREAPALVDFIMSKECPVSTSLTEDDKAKLLKIKQDAEKKFPSAPASKNGK